MQEYRKQIMFTLKQVHVLGIEHGDFAERNVVQGRFSCIIRLLRPRYQLIDFSHARTSHHCRGAGCHELQDAMMQLGLTPDDLSLQSCPPLSLWYFAIFDKLTTGVVLAVAWIGSGLGWGWRDQFSRRFGSSLRCPTFSFGWWQLICKRQSIACIPHA
jgi:hypothetical protein